MPTEMGTKVNFLFEVVSIGHIHSYRGRLNTCWAVNDEGAGDAEETKLTALSEVVTCRSLARVGPLE